MPPMSIRAPYRTRLALLALFAAVYVSSGCREPVPEDHPAGQLRFPIGVAADPAGDFIYVTNSNFDLRYLGGTVVAIDVSTNKVVGNPIQIESFAGEMVFHDDGAEPALYITNREQNIVTEVNVTRVDGAPTFSCALTFPTLRRSESQRRNRGTQHVVGILQPFGPISSPSNALTLSAVFCSSSTASFISVMAWSQRAPAF